MSGVVFRRRKQMLVEVQFPDVSQRKQSCIFEYCNCVQLKNLFATATSHIGKWAIVDCFSGIVTEEKNDEGNLSLLFIVLIVLNALQDWSWNLIVSETSYIMWLLMLNVIIVEVDIIKLRMDLILVWNVWNVTMVIWRNANMTGILYVLQRQWFLVRCQLMHIMRLRHLIRMLIADWYKLILLL